MESAYVCSKTIICRMVVPTSERNVHESPNRRFCFIDRCPYRIANLIQSLFPLIGVKPDRLLTSFIQGLPEPTCLFNTTIFLVDDYHFRNVILTPEYFVKFFFESSSHHDSNFFAKYSLSTFLLSALQLLQVKHLLHLIHNWLHLALFVKKSQTH